MSSVVARQSLRIPMIWSDASRLGAFVDFLQTLVEPEPSPTLAPVRTPEWSVRTPQRSVRASGSWKEVEAVLPWPKARTLSVTVSGDDVEFYLSSSWLEVTLEITAPSQWLDENVPLIRTKLRALCPAGLYVVQRGVAFFLFGLGFIGLVLGLNTAPAAYVVFGLLVAGAVGFALPVLRLGPQRRSIWLRAVGWLLTLGAGALLGALVPRWLFPS